MWVGGIGASIDSDQPECLRNLNIDCFLDMVYLDSEKSVMSLENLTFNCD